jgi:hypothetical protein
MFKKIGITLGLVSFLAVGVYAASVHFKTAPTFTDNGTTLTVCAALAGLGNQDVTITVTSTGSGSTTCVNPSGFQAPGQNKVAVASSVSQTISASAIKNGNLSFCQTTPGPINDVSFETATITVVQGGKTVLQQDFILQ